MMDLDNLDLEQKSEEGASLQLEHPVTGLPLEHEGKPMIIVLAGADSKVYRSKQKDFQNRRLQNLSRGKKADYTNLDAENIELLAVCTLSWSGIVAGGKELKYSVGAARELYEKHYWIREQVEAFVGERANFFTKV